MRRLVPGRQLDGGCGQARCVADVEMIHALLGKQATEFGFDSGLYFKALAAAERHTMQHQFVDM